MIVLFLAMALPCHALATTEPNEIDKICKSWRVMGRLFIGLDDVEKSKEYFEKAFYFAKSHPVSSLELGRCFIDLAWIYKEIGKFHDAKSLCAEGLRIHEAILGKEHPYIADTWRIMADIHRQIGEYELAWADISHALAIFGMYHNPGEPAYGPLYLDMGSILLDSGALTEAESYYLEAEKMILSTFGSEHPFTAILYSRLAGLYVTKNESSLAMFYLNKSTRINNKYEISNPLKTVPNYLLQARIYILQGNYKDALYIAQKAASICTKPLGKNHPLTGQSLDLISKININS